jgi:hypothetical protein
LVILEKFTKILKMYIILVLSKNIISISYLAFSGFKFIIEKKYCSLYNNCISYGFGNYINDLYILDFETLLFNINCKKNRLDNQYPSYL